MRNVSLKLAASLLVFAGAAAPAAAQDAKNYPGVACHASGTADDNVVRSSSLGRAFNQATVATSFSCPAVKDFGSIAGGVAWVVDRNPNVGQPVNCWLRSGRPDSQSVFISMDTTEPTGGTFSSSTPVRLTFGGLSGLSEGFYWLRCDVPGAVSGAQSGVVTYQITEND